MLQIDFLQTLKSVCLIISVLDYFPVDASCKTLLSSLDDNTLGLPPDFFLLQLLLSCKKLCTTVLDLLILFAISRQFKPDEDNLTILLFSNSVNLFALGIL